MLAYKILTILSLFISSVVFAQEIDLPSLRAEIESGPLAVELAPHVTAGSMQAIADILNRKDSCCQVDNFVTVFDLEEAVDPADWPQSGADQWRRDLWRDILLSVGLEEGINANATNLRAKVLLVFDPATNTRTNLMALQTRNGSRIEELFGVGVSVSHKQVAASLE